MPRPVPLIGGAGIAALLGKGLEYMIQKLLAHTDAGIGNASSDRFHAVVLGSASAMVAIFRRGGYT